MKSNNASNSKLKQKQGTSENTSANNSKKDKTGVTFSDAGDTATEKAKSRSGRGLANEGTIVSYDEQR